MSQARRPILRKEDTVLLGKFENLQVKEEKTEHEKAVDLVYRHCHFWSQRKPERAKETVTDDVDYCYNLAPPVKGIGMLQGIAFQIHDCLEDFHLTMQEVIFEGTMQEGKIAFKVLAEGNWIKPLGSVQPPKEAPLIQTLISVFGDVKDGKLTKIQSMSSSTQSTEWESALRSHHADVKPM